MYFTFTFQAFASARATQHQNTAVQKNRRAANEWMQTVERLQKIKEKEMIPGFAYDLRLGQRTLPSDDMD